MQNHDEIDGGGIFLEFAQRSFTWLTARAISTKDSHRRQPSVVELKTPGDADAASP